MFTLVFLAPLLSLLSSAVHLVGCSDGDGPVSTATPTPVSAQDIAEKFVRPAHFSQLAYCPSDLVKAWNCGQSCQAMQMGGFNLLTAGGDGQVIPYFFVGHDNATQSIVVAHEGTNPSSILSILNDANFELEDMNHTLFPNIGSDVKAHKGFAEVQGRSANEVLPAVQSALRSTGTNNVLTTGHSLGAAIAALDALMLRQNLDSSVSIDAIVFGLPRTGNLAFANLIDSQLGHQFTHVTHGYDPIPKFPPRDFGYQHSAGEVHIPSNGESGTVACPGQENVHCQYGNSIWHMSISDHLGPYFAGTEMGRSACPL